MKFAIITHVVHKKIENEWFAYEPYVREMNLWLKQVNQTKIVAPKTNENRIKIETNYKGETIFFEEIPNFNLIGLKEKVKSIFKIPIVFIKIIKTMMWADHIHLRCPGNVGLLGCIAQIAFPSKPKTVKYAGNWDPKSRQPKSYNFQKWLISNTFLTRNCQVLVYGEWENQSKNIKPFFTASYWKKDIEKIPLRNFDETINFIFVGTFSEGKQPLLSVKVVEELFKKGESVHLDMYGDGAEFAAVSVYIIENKLSEVVTLHGNSDKKIVQQAFERSHFLLFISKSEGWPKVVAEAMFWGCLPITSKVSCVPFMLGNETRGALVEASVASVSEKLAMYLKDADLYKAHVLNAQNWSQQYTLDRFENEIQKLLK
ncbi:glycosyltransferase family 4 protein [Flavicella sediminum]|uniref:glycosyltransferase family 4 protein n=1 Tax=Flavicella sediminum TaxID=2585141 RepID=UPI001121094B|nr:glycosyltransferase [Flavicella sediminum]